LRKIAVVAISAAAVCQAFAFDGTSTGGPDAAALPVVAAPTGVAVINRPVPPADIPMPQTSLSALQYAAEDGHFVAQWKLGRMYANGEGVARDDLRAYDYFSKIANAHADDSPSAPQAAIVANAFVALGRYYTVGIPNTHVKADPERAREMFAYAASYFGNAEAQYNLARMYLNGVGIQRDMKYGVRWLGLAAQKGQHQAQALLGQMMFNGDHLQRQAAKGLMWMALAQEGVTPDEAWIKDSYNTAIAKASDDDRAMAVQMLNRWVQGRRD
jgi:TPR repeat protein